MVEGEPGTRGQGKKRRKSAGPPLPGKKYIMIEMQPRARPPSMRPAIREGRPAASRPRMSTGPYVRLGESKRPEATKD
jgi:hypothetical protein